MSDTGSDRPLEPIVRHDGERLCLLEQAVAELIAHAHQTDCWLLDIYERDASESRREQLGLPGPFIQRQLLPISTDASRAFGVERDRYEAIARLVRTVLESERQRVQNCK